jgi:hypothetical protein
LDESIDVGRAVLEKLVWMTRFALWEGMGVRIKIEETKREKGRVPNIMTATSTEHRTPSSYAFLKRPVLR